MKRDREVELCGEAVTAMELALDAAAFLQLVLENYYGGCMYA